MGGGGEQHTPDTPCAIVDLRGPLHDLSYLWGVTAFGGIGGQAIDASSTIVGQAHETIPPWFILHTLLRPGNPSLDPVVHVQYVPTSGSGPSADGEMSLHLASAATLPFFVVAGAQMQMGRKKQ